MGILFSLVISYAGVNEAIDCMRHIMCGMIPEGDPDFQELVEYYNKLLLKSSNQNPSKSEDWSKLGGQGYLSLTDDDDGKLNKAAIKYYDGTTDSTALLFSTKISSFGQESVESVGSNQSKANGDYANKQSERYTTTKTMVTNTSESFSVGQRNKSPTASYENISDPTLFSGNSFTSNEDEEEEKAEVKEKLTWHYRPLSPVPTLLPEIHFQSYDESANRDSVYPEEFLRSLDGIKYRPLQRSDPSGRRRSFKKRHSSSSTSSKDSRASREEELKMFTSLEEAEFERMDQGENVTGFGSTPNLVTRSHSRSRSRESSKERRNHEASHDSSIEEADYSLDLKPKLKDMGKLGSFEEEQPEVPAETQTEVNEVEDDDDFWGNSGD